MQEELGESERYLRYKEYARIRPDNTPLRQ